MNASLFIAVKLTMYTSQHFQAHKGWQRVSLIMSAFTLELKFNTNYPYVLKLCSILHHNTSLSCRNLQFSILTALIFTASIFITFKARYWRTRRSQHTTLSTTELLCHWSCEHPSTHGQTNDLSEIIQHSDNCSCVLSLGILVLLSLSSRSWGGDLEWTLLIYASLKRGRSYFSHFPEFEYILLNIRSL